MTESQFELFDIHCGDFLHNLIFFQKQNRDPYTGEMLEDLINKVRLYRRVIQEVVDTESV